MGSQVLDGRPDAGRVTHPSLHHAGYQHVQHISAPSLLAPCSMGWDARGVRRPWTRQHGGSVEKRQDARYVDTCCHHISMSPSEANRSLFPRGACAIPPAECLGRTLPPPSEPGRASGLSVCLRRYRIRTLTGRVDHGALSLVTVRREAGGRADVPYSQQPTPPQHTAPHLGPTPNGSLDSHGAAE